MKITCTSVYKYGIYIVLLLNLGCFNFIFHSFFISLALSLIVSFILLLIYLFQKERVVIKGLFLKTYVFFELSILIIEYFRLQSSTMPIMTTREAFGPFGVVLLIILSFPIVEVLNKERELFLRDIAIIGYTVLLIRFIIWFIYNFFHVNLGFEYMGGRITWIRPIFNGMLLTRTMGTFIDGYLMVYTSINLYLNKKRWKRYVLGLLFLLFYEGIVFQSRSQFLFFILTFIFTSLVVVHFSKNKILNIFLMICVLLGISMVLLEDINSFINSFSVNSQYGESTLTRMLEYEFFPKLWKTTNLFLGFGMTPDMFSIGISKLYISDLGLIAVLYQFGIVGFIIAIMPFLRGIFISIKKWYQVTVNKIDYFIIILTFYLVISSVNLNPYNYLFYPLVPIYVGILFFDESLS